MRSSNDSPKSRKSTSLTWLSWGIFRMSIRMKKNNSLTLSGTSKRKSRSSLPFSIFSWTATRSIWSSTILNGMRKNDSGKCPISPTNKKMSTYPNFSPNKSPKSTSKLKRIKNNYILETLKGTTKKNPPHKMASGSTIS